MDAREELVARLKAEKVKGMPQEWFTMTSASSVEPSDPELVEGESNGLIEANVRDQVQVKVQGGDGVEDISQMGWEELEKTASGCTKCRLCETRNKVVFGVGKRTQPVVAFIGEGPGADEDATGEPFVGRAGKLLTGAITAGMGLKREDVYIANVVKCRPPQNRAPLPDEVEACTPYLYRQLELLQPKTIVTLGQPAQRATSAVDLGITKLHGQWQTWRGFKLMPTFHPAYILRNPPAKKPFWEDLQLVMKELGLEVPKNQP